MLGPDVVRRWAIIAVPQHGLELEVLLLLLIVDILDETGAQLVWQFLYL